MPDFEEMIRLEMADLRSRIDSVQVDEDTASTLPAKMSETRSMPIGGLPHHWHFYAPIVNTTTITSTSSTAPDQIAIESTGETLDSEAFSHTTDADFVRIDSALIGQRIEIIATVTYKVAAATISDSAQVRIAQCLGQPTSPSDTILTDYNRSSVRMFNLVGAGGSAEYNYELDFFQNISSSFIIESVSATAAARDIFIGAFVAQVGAASTGAVTAESGHITLKWLH